MHDEQVPWHYRIPTYDFRFKDFGTFYVAPESTEWLWTSTSLIRVGQLDYISSRAPI